MAASKVEPGNHAGSSAAIVSEERLASHSGVPTSTARVSTYQGYHSSHRETCRVCVSRHLAHYDDPDANRIVNIREAIEVDESDQLAYNLKHGYPGCMLLDCLFLAVKHDAWECLGVLLMEQHSNVWIQFSNSEGHNILQEIICKPIHEQIKRCILSILERLQHSMDKVCLKAYVNKLWAPEHGDVLDIGSILHENRVSLLHVAVFEAHLEIAAELLKCGADPNQLCSNDHSPLMMAAMNADFDMIDLLVSHGANFVHQHAHKNSKYWDTALTILATICCQNGRCVPSGRGKMCIMDVIETETLQVHEFKAIVPHLDMEMMSVLVNNGFPSNISFQSVDRAQFTSDDHLRSEFLQSALIATAFHARSGALELFCHVSTSLGVDINRPALTYESFFTETETNIHMCTALQAACQAGRNESVDCLLSFGADPDCTGINGSLPITHVLEYKRPGAIKCVTSLLRYGCSVNVVDLPEVCQSCRDLPPVDFYLSCNQLYIVRMLLAAGGRTYGREDVSLITSVYRVVMPAAICNTAMKAKVMLDLQEVPSLYHLSRTAVRSAMRQNLPSKIRRLPIPTHVKEFVNLSELDDIGKEFNEIEAPLFRAIIGVLLGFIIDII